jgi:hypothetical protein
MGTRYLYATCSSGLCNRLLMLAGSMRVAELTERHLIVDWPVNSQVGCSFDALFENRFRMFNEEHLARLLRTDECVKIYNAVKIKPHYNRISSDGDPEADIVLIKAWGPPMLDTETWDRKFSRDLQPYLRQLNVRPEFLARADEYPLPPRCLGVHIRRGDKQPEFFESSDEHFEILMDSVIAACPDVSFFLATAVEETETRFRRRFGDRVISFPKTCTGRHQAAIEEALIDLLLLSRTRAVLGNYFSSYSFAASVLGPNVIVNATEETAGLKLEKGTAELVEALNESAPVLRP